MNLFELVINCILLQVLKGQLSISLLLGQQQLILFSNSQANSQFILNDNFLICASSLFQYGQSSQQYASPPPNIITIQNNTQNISLSISTQYNRFLPTINSTSCNSPTCTISLQNNCPSPLNDINYFDILSISIQPIGTFSYFLNCDIGYNTTYFQLGGLILICLTTLILIAATNLGRWNAFKGYGIKYQYKMIVFVSASILTVGLLSLYQPPAAQIIIDIGNTATIIASITVLSIEVLYFFKISSIQRVIFSRSSMQIRIMDVLGVVCSIPVVVAWWLWGSNWIFSDILSVLFIVSIIKVFKFVSFKVALVAYLVMVSIYISADIIVAISYKNSFQQYSLFQTNTPYQFQFPLITPAYGGRCIFISITTIAFPGLLVSYLRRFDQSRSTRIYLVTAVGTYFLGSVVWWIVSTFSYYPLPFNAFCQPIMIIAFTLFAFKRKQLRTLWEGKFFDQQFKNKDQLEEIGTRIAQETPNKDYFKEKLGETLFFEMKDDSQLDHGQAVNSKIRNDQL